MDIQSCQDILENLYDGLYIVDQHRKITFWNKGAEKITGFSKTEGSQRQRSGLPVGRRGIHRGDTGQCPEHT